MHSRRAGPSAVAIFGLVLLAAVASALPASASSTGSTSHAAALQDLDGAVAYLRGLWAGGGASDEETPYLLEGAAASGSGLDGWAPGLPEAVRASAEEHGATLIGLLRPTHALARAGLLDPKDALVQRVLAAYDGEQFGSASALNDDTWAILALAAAGIDPHDDRLVAAGRFVASQGSMDGGWGWAVGSHGETDSTGMAVVAMARTLTLDAHGRDRALAWMGNASVPGSGWRFTREGDANCDSTVWAIRALDAMGRTAPPEAWAFVGRLRNADGSFSYMPGDRSRTVCTSEVALLMSDWLAAGKDVSGYPERPAAATGSAGAPSGPVGVAAALALAGTALVRRRRPT